MTYSEFLIEIDELFESSDIPGLYQKSGWEWYDQYEEGLTPVEAFQEYVESF